MEYRLTARHFNPSDGLKQYLDKQLKRLKKFYQGIIDCEVILYPEKLLQVAEIQLKVDGALLTAVEKSDDMFKSVDLAVEKIERQLKKHKEKLQMHNGEKLGRLFREASEKAESAE
ncbi:MAG: ribosome-associated translation inhibitor RaiA [candidate division KSB1 bacterium]|nr:ribosome-associated translation inhibitor RaiA [candidate division KSB1 bacterium]